MPGSFEWQYDLQWSNGAMEEMVKRSEGMYYCLRSSSSASWTCDGPDTTSGGNGVAIYLSPFVPEMQVSALHSALGVGASLRAAVHLEMTRRRVAGEYDHCVSAVGYGSWCLTTDGRFARFSPANIYPSSLGASDDTGTLEQVARVVSQSQFALPTNRTHCLVRSCRPAIVIRLRVIGSSDGLGR